MNKNDYASFGWRITVSDSVAHLLRNPEAAVAALEDALAKCPAWVAKRDRDAVQRMIERRRSPECR